MAGVRNTTLLKLFIAWFLFNGIAAFTLAKLAGAHWSSATTGGLVAWLTSINPMLAPGWFAGYVELRYTQVNVSDISRLNEILADEESPLRQLFKQMLDVPLFRVMAIVAMTNIGSFIASILFPIIIIPWLGTEIGSVGAIGDALLQGAENSATVITEFLT
jgi:pheromone shutdown protein TraB